MWLLALSAVFPAGIARLPSAAAHHPSTRFHSTLDPASQNQPVIVQPRQCCANRSATILVPLSPFTQLPQMAAAPTLPNISQRMHELGEANRR
jgi:hypothetical protein